MFKRGHLFAGLVSIKPWLGCWRPPESLFGTWEMIAKSQTTWRIPSSSVWGRYAGAYRDFRPLNGMLVHRRATYSIKFAGTHSYTWVKRGTVRVKCLAQEHSTMFSVRAPTRTVRGKEERTNHGAAPFLRETILSLFSLLLAFYYTISRRRFALK